MKKVFCLIIIIVLSIVLFCSCNQTGQYLIFNTFVDIDLSGSGATKAIKQIKSQLNEIENDMSVSVSTSYVSKINNAKAGEKIEVNDEFMSLLKVAKYVYEKSSHAFDITIFPLVKLWNFSADTYTGVETSIPTDEEILCAKNYVGFDKLIIDENALTVTKTIDEVKIDLGGIAKGYALSKAMSIASGLKGIINIGGNIGAVSKNLTVGIQNPRGSGYIGTFTLISGYSVSTSGDYERQYNVNDVNYHHIISPFTGYPTGLKGDSNIISVSIVSKNYAMTDALSTAVMVLGVEEGKKLIEEVNAQGIIVTTEKTIVVGNLDYKIS